MKVLGVGLEAKELKKELAEGWGSKEERGGRVGGENGICSGMAAGGGGVERVGLMVVES